MRDSFAKQYKNIIAKIKLTFAGLTWRLKIILILLVLTFISVAVFWLFTFVKQNKNSINSTNASGESPSTLVKKNDNIPANYVRRSIDGLYVDSDTANIYPIAVMIDNDPNARPQAGLARAQIVYEAKAEAGITRFMAIFASGEDVDNVGPIRSARPYFVDWARGYGALYAHVGGSPEALDILSNISLFNINEFYQGKYFWRENSKQAPHNVYSAIKNFNEYLGKLNAKNNGFDAWLYKDEIAIENRGETDVEINYSVNDFLVQWQYDKENNEYARYLGGARHQDANGEQIKAKNIIIIKVAATVIDEAFRRRMDTIGEGKSWYCLDGMCHDGVWKKSSSDTREKIYSSNNEEVYFNAGTTWVQVVQEDGEVSFGD